MLIPVRLPSLPVHINPGQNGEENITSIRYVRIVVKAPKGWPWLAVGVSPRTDEKTWQKPRRGGRTVMCRPCGAQALNLNPIPWATAHG